MTSAPGRSATVTPLPAPAPDSDAAVGSSLDVATLVARAREGDADAFEDLVHRHQRRIYQLALRMTRSVRDAEDLTQEVFLAAWRRLPQLDDDGAFGGWLWTAATRRCLNYLERTRTAAPLEDTTLASTDPGGDPERAAISGGRREAIEEALMRISPDLRAAWLLREVHGRSYEEIADAVGVPASTVRGRLARARAALVEELTPWR